FVAREASHAVWDATTGVPSGTDGFLILRGTNGLLRVRYDGPEKKVQGLKRSVQKLPTGTQQSAFLIEDTPGQMEIKEFALNFSPAGDPVEARVYVKIETKDKNRVEERVFTATAPLLNRRRYKYD
ncbi:MAG: hypothetical protein N3G20_10760, partial [Verrucomicrobiae bacterium]|nr:hypothetical protein [Verrucomicrobiae bacterium]